MHAADATKALHLHIRRLNLIDILAETFFIMLTFYFSLQPVQEKIDGFNFLHLTRGLASIKIVLILKFRTISPFVNSRYVTFSLKGADHP